VSMTDIIPGELNTLLDDANVRAIGRDDVDASGKGMYRHKKYTVNKLIEKNVLAGITKFKAQVLFGPVEVTAGPGIFARILGDTTAQRSAFRIRIPEIHQSIPFPFDYKDKDPAAFRLYMSSHPLAIYESTGLLGGENIEAGDIVWVVFSKGVGGNRLYQPIIEAKYSDGAQAGESMGIVQSAINLFTGGTAGTGGTIANVALSSGQIEQLTNNTLSDGNQCERARALFVKLQSELNSAGGRALYGLTEQDRINIIVGLMANAYAESSFKPAIGSGVDITGRSLSGAMALKNANGVVSDSWGLWQNNISIWDGGGTSLLKYYQENFGFSGFPLYTDQADFYTKMTSYVKESEENRSAAASILLNEDIQISYAVSVILAAAGQAHPKEPNAPSMTQAIKDGYAGFDPGSAESAAAWWQVAYERSKHSPAHRAGFVSQVMPFLENIDEPC
jgi:hypothetical protein